MCSRLKILVPVKVIVHIEEGLRELRGQLEELGGGKARIRLDHPLPEGNELEVLVEFKDRSHREIRFRYKGRVASITNDTRDGVDLDLEEGVGMSGEHVAEILAELFPKEGESRFHSRLRELERD